MATTLNVIITDAGIAEVINAEHTGTAPVVLTQVGVGRGVYTPTADQTALHDEIKRLSSISGGVVGDNIMHIQALDGAADASYAVYEIGIYTASGTLFAVYSQALPIIHKVADSEIMLAIDFVLAGFEPTSVTVGDTNYSLAPATTSNQGVVELATDDEAIAGTDDERALTPKSGAAAIADHAAFLAVGGTPGHFSFRAGSGEPFTMITTSTHTYHSINRAYFDARWVALNTTAQTIDGAKTFAASGSVSFLGGVSFAVTGFTISNATNGTAVTINGNGIVPAANYSFDIGDFDNPISRIVTQYFYADEIGSASNSDISVVNDVSVQGDVTANSFHGILPNPDTTQTTAATRYPVGCIILARVQAGAFTTGVTGFGAGKEGTGDTSYSIYPATYIPSTGTFTYDSNLQLNTSSMTWKTLSGCSDSQNISRGTYVTVLIMRIA